MRIKFIEKKDYEAKFILENAKTSFASALRRCMIGEIPILAIDEVDFLKNDSALNDEIIAHRIGLIPLRFDPKMFNLKNECKCKGKGCSLCEVKFVLKKKGIGKVYSKDLKSKNKDVEPLYQNIIITELFNEEDEIELEATARLGFGKDHAKWQGAIVGYEIKNSSFIFEVESACGLKVEDILKLAVKTLKNKFKELEKKIENM